MMSMGGDNLPTQCMAGFPVLRRSRTLPSITCVAVVLSLAFPRRYFCADPLASVNWVNSFCVGTDNFEWCLVDHVDNPDEPNNTPRYIASLYWVFATYATVGYGDVHAAMVSDTELGMR